MALPDNAVGPGARAALLRFGQLLVNKGYVDVAAIVEALDLQRQGTLPIGRLALQKKLFIILNAQIDTPKRFGEIAVELACCHPPASRNC